MRIGLQLQRPSRTLLVGLLELLARHNEDYLRKHPRTPALDAAGVRFRREARGQEEWLDVPAVLAARFGDCEDLAAWRAAELRLAGVAARVAIGSGGRARLLHAVVVLPNGRVDDPTRRLR